MKKATNSREERTCKHCHTPFTTKGWLCQPCEELQHINEESKAEARFVGGVTRYVDEGPKKEKKKEIPS